MSLLETNEPSHEISVLIAYYVQLSKAQTNLCSCSFMRAFTAPILRGPVITIDS